MVGSPEFDWSGAQVAIVVARDLDYGIGRMFKAYADGAGIDYQLFRELEAAQTWLAAAATPAP